jgi:lantibiotic biosynthesis protein
VAESRLGATIRLAVQPRFDEIRTEMSRRTIDLVEAAADIGGTLCKSAYWHEDRCNWIGRSTNELTGAGMPLTPTVAALGPTLYAGTAGIALFLAELFARTDHDQAGATARGAIRHSLARAGEIAPRLRRAFYSGLVGIAYAAAQVGTRTDDSQIVAEGIKLARQAVEAHQEHNLLDVISGNAGAVGPLLRLATHTDGERLRAAAIAFAEELATDATRSEATWCWENERACGHGMGPTPLCGLAHGASGMGLALVEAGVHSGRDDLVEGGLAAFRYEDRLYDAEHENWPDLRELEGDGNGQAATPRMSFMVAWCHGAAGIGLARLRAYEVLPERRAELRPGVEHAVRTTASQLRTLPREIDASPCHGRAGLAETLLCATEVLDDPTYADHVETMWKKLLRARNADTPWPCGVASGTNNPSLMLGYAGIGYSLLRADDSAATSSALIVTGSNHA